MSLKKIYAASLLAGVFAAAGAIPAFAGNPLGGRIGSPGGPIYYNGTQTQRPYSPPHHHHRDNGPPPGYNGGYDDGYDRGEPRYNRGRSPHGSSVTASPCGNSDITDFPDAGVAFQQCGSTGVTLGHGPRGYLVTRIFDLYDPQQSAQFSQQYNAAASRQESMERSYNQRRQQEMMQQRRQWEYHQRQNGPLNEANETLRQGNQILQQLNYGRQMLRYLGR